MHERVMIAVVIKLLRTGPAPLLIDLIDPYQIAVSRYFAGLAPSVAAITMVRIMTDFVSVCLIEVVTCELCSHHTQTLARLCACQLLSTDDPLADLHQQVRLRISEAEVRVAYAEDAILLSLMG